MRARVAEALFSGSRTDRPPPQLAYDGPGAEFRDRRLQFSRLAREVGIQFPGR
jgi:hypothetical protein